MSAETQGYRFLEHVTDAEIEAFGSTLEESFENAAKALEDTMVDIKTIDAISEEKVRISARDMQELLYRWLEWLIFKQDTEDMLYSKFNCKIFKKEKQIILESEASGEKFDSKKHEQKTAIKAPTYHNMMIDQNPDLKSVTLKFLLDL